MNDKVVRIGMPTLMEYHTIEENMELARKLEVDFVELNINMLYCKPDDELRHKLLEYKKEGFDFTLHYYDTLDISSTSRYYRNYLYTEFSEIGKHMEGILDRIVLHIEPGAFMTIHSEKQYVYKFDETYIPRTINTIKTIQEVLETFGIDIVLENVPIHPFMEGLYQAIGENGFHFCFDIGHNVIYNDRLFESFLKKYNLQIKHMHMHNVLGLKDHQELAVGDLDIPFYIDFAKNNNIDIVVEVKDQINLSKSVQFIKDYIKKQSK